MRALNPFAAHHGALISNYAAKLAEAIAVRRAELDARTARAEAELSIRARSEFLANMNHELRTPLNAIIGFSTMLKDGETYVLSEEQRRSYAEYVIQSADLLLGHINTILETAALDSGAVELKKDDVDLVALLDEAIGRASIAAASAGVTIERKSAGEIVPCYGDAERIGQAIDHLLRTAVRASPKGARVFARAKTVGESAEIAIRDNGEGLTSEAIRQALSAFDEVHRGLDRSFAGPGVGFAIAKTFVEMQGGRFDIQSKTGEGTIVRLLMPPPEAKDSEITDSEPAPARMAG